MKRRDWTVVSAEQMLAYLAEASTLVGFAKQHKISTFAAALAGVAFIRNAMAIMGGPAAWWCNLITSTSENPFDDIVVKPPSGDGD